MNAHREKMMGHRVKPILVYSFQRAVVRYSTVRVSSATPVPVFMNIPGSIAFCSWNSFTLGKQEAYCSIRVLSLAMCSVNKKNRKGKGLPTGMGEEMDAKVHYCMEWEKRDKKLITAFNRCAEVYKRDKRREEIVKLLDVIQKHSDGPMHFGASELQKCLARQEPPRNEKAEESIDNRKMILVSRVITKHFEDRLKTFANVELKSAKHACVTLEKLRLGRDAATNAAAQVPTEENQRKAEVAEKEFQLQLNTTKELLNKIPDYEKFHEDALVQGVKYLSTAF
ncbi:hypothetical protein Y032_0096g2918 [Ancylostoma ceylanicum]|nr:hypothetical protein Y032_0096g2918 [Ancylostoma ceylanicum]